MTKAWKPAILLYFAHRNSLRNYTTFSLLPFPIAKVYNFFCIGLPEGVAKMWELIRKLQTAKLVLSVVLKGVMCNCQMPKVL